MMRTENLQDGHLHVYYVSTPSYQILNVVKIAQCLGISVELIDLGVSHSPADDLKAQMFSGKGAAVWDIASLIEQIGLADWELIASRLSASSADVLILVTSENRLQNKILKILTQGKVTEVHSAGHAALVEFPATVRYLITELGGQQYPRSSRDALTMDVSEDSGIEIVMEFGVGLPSFVFLQCDVPHTFIWSTFSVFDVDLPLKRETDFEQSLDEYVPAIIFLRRAFGDRCWHSPWIGVDIIIDDPLLTKRYGFIVFPKLLQFAKELGFHLTVAFIPWNHWRTRRESVRTFLDHPASFGICVHGCDHARNEFLSTDYHDLLHRSHLAAQWMNRHRERTGMGWARLMVCPREQYSIEALEAFADSGQFLGLVNTGCLPRGLNTEIVRGSDLLLPAQDALFGFPVFKRHYWSDISVFAMAAFLGKPLILVEHHDFFRDQYRLLESFVSQLSSTCPTARWSDLTDLVRKTYQQRRVSSQILEVRFFTDEVLMQNPDPEPRLVRFRRRIPLGIFVESVTVNGAPISYARDGEFICFESRLNGNDVAEIHLQRRTIQSNGKVLRDWTYGAGIATRRFLSEIRDNWLSRSGTALRIANRLMQNVRLRGPG